MYLLLQDAAFTGLQSIMSVVTVAMYLLYSQTRELHDKMILETNIEVMEKYQFSELLGFVYYKITTILQILLIGTRVRSFRHVFKEIRGNPNQMTLFC